MASSHDALTPLAERLFERSTSKARVGAGRRLFDRLGLANPYDGGAVEDGARASRRMGMSFLSSEDYFAELRGMALYRRHLLQRIGQMRASARVHERFERRVATESVRALQLGDASLLEPTLVDWSTQVDAEDMEAEESVQPRRTRRMTAAERALQADIAQASRTLGQLRDLARVARDDVSASIERALPDLARSTDGDRARQVRQLARSLRGLKAVAARGTSLDPIGGGEERAGARPLAAAQRRQDPSDPRGLRRQLETSPVMMELERPFRAPEPEEEPTVRRSRATRPVAERRHAHRSQPVARVADEARQQAGVGRAGPPAIVGDALASSPRRVRHALRPTERIARTARRASDTPLYDTTRGLDVARAASAVNTPAQRTARRLEVGLLSSEGRALTGLAHAGRSTVPGRSPAGADVAPGPSADVRTLAERLDGAPERSVRSLQVPAEITEASFASVVSSEPVEALESGALPTRRPRAGVRPSPVTRPGAAGRTDSAASVAPRGGIVRPTSARPERADLPPLARALERSFAQTVDIGSLVPEPVRSTRSARRDALPLAGVAGETSPVRGFAGLPGDAVRPLPGPLVADQVDARSEELSFGERLAERLMADRGADSMGPLAERTVRRSSGLEVLAADELRTADQVAIEEGEDVPASTGTRRAPNAAVRTSAQERLVVDGSRRHRARPAVRAASRAIAQERSGARGRLLAPSVSSHVDVVSAEHARLATSRVVAPFNQGRAPLGLGGLQIGERPLVATPVVDAPAALLARREAGARWNTEEAEPGQRTNDDLTERLFDRSADGDSKDRSLDVLPADAAVFARTTAAEDLVEDERLAGSRRAATRAVPRARQGETGELLAPRVVAPFSREDRSIESRVERRLGEQATVARPSTEASRAPERFTPAARLASAESRLEELERRLAAGSLSGEDLRFASPADHADGTDVAPVPSRRAPSTRGRAAVERPAADRADALSLADRTARRVDAGTPGRRADVAPSLAERLGRVGGLPDTSSQVGGPSAVRPPVSADARDERSTRALATPTELTVARALQDDAERDSAQPTGMASRASRRGREAAATARRQVSPAVTPEIQVRALRRSLASAQAEVAALRTPTGETPITGTHRTARGETPVTGTQRTPSTFVDGARSFVTTPVDGPGTGRRRTLTERIEGMVGHRTRSGLTEAVRVGGLSVAAHDPALRASALAAGLDPAVFDALLEQGADVAEVESTLGRALRRTTPVNDRIAASPVLSDVASRDGGPRELRGTAPEMVVPGTSAEAEEATPDGARRLPVGRPVRRADLRASADQARSPSTARALARGVERRDEDSVIGRPVTDDRTARAATRSMAGPALVDGILVTPGREAVDTTSIAGGERRRAHRPGRSRSRMETASRQVATRRAATRQDEPLLALPMVRRALEQAEATASPARRAGRTDAPAPRFEARLETAADGTVLGAVVVDAETGRTLARPSIRAERRLEGAEPAESGRRTSARTRRLADDSFVSVGPDAPEMSADVAGRPLLPGRPGAMDQTLEALVRRPDAQRGENVPRLRRRTWQRRSAAAELGVLTPVLADADHVPEDQRLQDAPAWARRAGRGTAARAAQTGEVARPEREASSLMGVLARAERPDEIVKVIIDRRTEIREVRGELPAEAVRLMERISTFSGAEAELLRKGERILPAAPMQNTLQSRSHTGGAGLTQLSQGQDGLGATKIMKLADKLMGLIHLAENNRQKEAQDQVRMAQDSLEARAEGGAKFPGLSVEDHDMNIEALQKAVLDSVLERFEELDTRREDPDGHNKWW